MVVIILKKLENLSSLFPLVCNYLNKFGMTIIGALGSHIVENCHCYFVHKINKSKKPFLK